MLRPPRPPAILLLGSYRSDETEKSPFLQAWAELQRKNDVQLPRRDVCVGPLTQDQCVELMIVQVGQDSEVVRRRAVEFFQETGGNPFFLIELISCFDAATDSFRPLPLNEVIDRKLQQLPGDARRLLEVVAVSGQALSLGELSTTAGQDTPAVATITHMRSEKTRPPRGYRGHGVGRHLPRQDSRNGLANDGFRLPARDPPSPGPCD